MMPLGSTACGSEDLLSHRAWLAPVRDLYRLWNFFTASQRKEIGLSPAKAQRRKGDGPMPVIPSKWEDLKMISPFGRSDKESFFPNLAPLRLCGR
jgi:hypothetical protein